MNNMNDVIKSLENKLADLEEGSIEWINNVLELSRMLWTVDGKRSLEISEKAMEYAQKINYERGIAYANRNLTMINYASGKADPSEIYQKLSETLEWFTNNDEKQGIADISMIIGLFLWAHGEYEKGFNFAFEALDLYEKLDQPEALGWTYNSIGGFYFDSKDFNKSKKYHQLAYNVFNKSDHTTGIARSLNGLANAYHLEGELEKAIEYHQKALDLEGRDEFEFTRSRILNDIGKIRYDQKDYDKAYEYQTQSLKIREALNYPHGITTTLMDRGKSLAALKRFTEAEDDLKRALELTLQIDAKPKILRAHKILADIYKKQEKFDASLEHFEKYHQLLVDVHHEDLDSRLKNLRKIHQAESDKKEAEIFRLRNVELKEKNEELAQTVDQLNATQAQLIQADRVAALARLAAGVVHEINTPVSAILSSSDLAIKTMEKLCSFDFETAKIDQNTEIIKKYVRAVIQSSKTNKEAAERIHGVALSLKRFAALDEAVLKKGDIHDSINSALTLLSRELHGRITIEKDYGDIPEVFYYRGEFNQVIVNLLVNASQAIESEGKIWIKTHDKNKMITIEIRDNGKGIEADKLKGIFDPGFTNREAKTRMRTGLYSSYNIISKHDGHITVKSEPGKGSTFTINFPKRV